MFFMTFLHCLRHMQEQGGLTGTRRRDDESPLAATHGSHEIDDAGGVAIRFGFEADQFGRIDRFQFLKGGKLAGITWIHSIDSGDFDHLESPGAVSGNTFDPHTGAQTMFASEIGGNEDIFLCLFEILIGFAEEAKAFGRHFEEPVDVDRVSGEFKRFALSAVLTWTVAADPALLASFTIAAISVPVAIPVAVTVSTPAASLGVISGRVRMARAGARGIGIRRDHRLV